MGRHRLRRRGTDQPPVLVGVHVWDDEEQGFFYCECSHDDESCDHVTYREVPRSVFLRWESTVDRFWDLQDELALLVVGRS